jgi:hypothetical protein
VRVSLARVWAKDDPFGTEFSHVTLTGSTLTATGVAVGSQPCPYRLEYELQTAEGFVTSALAVRTYGRDWRRALVLQRSANGEWTCSTATIGELDLPPPGGDLSLLADALDCDLGLSPLTNTMPVLRHALLTGGGPVDLTMAWVAVPELAVVASPQRYTFVRREADRSIVRYESLDSDFSAEITFDAHGVVLDYPGIARFVT